MKTDHAIHGAMLLQTMASAMVGDREAVRVTTEQTESGWAFTVHTAAEDTGKLIGKQGKNARALRTIMSAAGMQGRSTYSVHILDKELA